MTVKNRHAHTGSTQRQIGNFKNLATFPEHFHFFFGIAVILKYIDLRQTVERDLLGEYRRGDLFLFENSQGLPSQFLNGAAARTCQKGDEIIICNSVYVTEQEIEQIKPVVLTFHPDNEIKERLGYDVGRDDQNRLSFNIIQFD